MNPWTDTPSVINKNNRPEVKMTRLRLLLIALVLGLYALEGILVNPLIFWVSIPIYFGYSVVASALKDSSKVKLRQGYGYLVLTVCFTYLYHFAWFFDWNDTKTGSSTSALIFLWFPVYAFFFGFAGYLFGLIGVKENKER
ncbi:hypothetical protein [Gilvimarinus algae]|uniref:Uncharacterized protein n=1 Tax=Gilvimarinus algae TaxID=3058037 RepID=A0ABT8TG59_9GAMM|nr:hypothetical protein [Gilvimarinus sp. SDUM040014]MDO3383013.1 hypothetical protein [Gilvimarinus sp. SDUM040014]